MCENCDDLRCSGFVVNLDDQLWKKKKNPPYFQCEHPTTGFVT